MHAGEEQFLEGMVDWDGQPNRKYDEYKTIAAEFRKIERFGFPYQPQPEVALAFSFPSQIASATPSRTARRTSSDRVQCFQQAEH